MRKKSKNIVERIDEKIKQRTGLKNSRDVEVYRAFSHHASSHDNSIPWGEVVYDICQILKKDCSEPMKLLEDVYHQSIGNHEGIPYPLEAKHFPSPLNKKAMKIYGQYLRKFFELGVVGISVPDVFRNCASSLIGYNYYNDPEFFTRTRPGCVESRT